MYIYKNCTQIIYK